MKLYENHAQDSRYNEVDICPTVVSRYGTGGGNVPLLLKEQGVTVMNALNQPVKTTLVRKLTVVECERLQGFPDEYTKVPYRDKPKEKCPDSPRYKAIGNSWAVPVVRWIGERINNALMEN